MWRDIVPPHFTNKGKKMRKFLVKIWAYDHYASFEVEAEDNAKSIENSILDKIGEKSINWESTGMYGPLNRITYEEVVDGTRAVQTKTVLGVEVAVGV